MDMAERYPEIEVYYRGAYVMCQVLTPGCQTEAVIACQTVDGGHQFMAERRMGAWMQADIRDVFRQFVTMQELLRDPTFVHKCMLTGGIAKLTDAQVKQVYPHLFEQKEDA